MGPQTPKERADQAVECMYDSNSDGTICRSSGLIMVLGVKMGWTLASGSGGLDADATAIRRELKRIFEEFPACQRAEA